MFNVPQSRGVNSTFSPMGRVPQVGDANPGSVGWGRKGNRQLPGDANMGRVGQGVGQGMGGGGSAPQRPYNEDAAGALRNTMTLPRPAGGVMGPGRSYPRASMGGGLDRLGGVRRSPMTL